MKAFLAAAMMVFAVSTVASGCATKSPVVIKPLEIVYYTEPDCQTEKEALRTAAEALPPNSDRNLPTALGRVIEAMDRLNECQSAGLPIKN